MKKCFLVAFIMIIINAFIINVRAEGQEYDVILFWGQSNMVGWGCSHKDVGLNEGDNVAFEYLYSSNSFREINDKLSSLGENLKYNPNTDDFDKLDSIPNRDYDKDFTTSHESCKTNIIPQFVKTYNSLTGRKVIAVMVAHGGERIAHFLPHDKVIELSSEKVVIEKKSEYIYELIVKKYNSAINLIKSNGDSIGRQFYVVFQGESDAVNGTSTQDYYDQFLMVHNNLKLLGIEYGGIIETSAGPKRPSDIIERIHSAQEALISNNKDIFLGSSYPYDNYYNYQNTGDIGMRMEDDIGHFNADGLALMGDESATAAAKYLIDNYDWLTELKINDEAIKLDGSLEYDVTVPNKTETIKIDAKLLSNQLSFDSNYGPRDVSLDEGLNVINLSVKNDTDDSVRTYKLNITREELKVNVEDTLASRQTLFIVLGFVLLIIGSFITIRFVKRKRI